MKNLIITVFFSLLTLCLFAEERPNYVRGILYFIDGNKIEGEFIVNFRDGVETNHFGDKIIDRLAASSQIIHKYPNKKRFKYKTYKTKDLVKFEIDENEIYDVVSYKEAMVTDGALGTDDLLKGPKPYFVKRLFLSDKIGVYKSYSEIIVFKTGEKAGVSTSNLSAKKKLVKLTADCPEVSKKMENAEYKGQEQIVQFAKDYTNCN